MYKLVISREVILKKTVGIYIYNIYCMNIKIKAKFITQI